MRYGKLAVSGLVLGTIVLTPPPEDYVSDIKLQNSYNRMQIDYTKERIGNLGKSIEEAQKTLCSIQR